MKHFAAWCAQEEETFLESWDLGHQLQIAYRNVMKESETIRKKNPTNQGCVSRRVVMSSNTACWPIKKEQETRWVRAELS